MPDKGGVILTFYKIKTKNWLNQLYTENIQHLEIRGSPGDKFISREKKELHILHTIFLHIKKPKVRKILKNKEVSFW